MDGKVCWSVVSPLLSKLKYLNNTGIHGPQRIKPFDLTVAPFWPMHSASFPLHADCLPACNQSPLKRGQYYSDYKRKPEHFRYQNLFPQILQSYADICLLRFIGNLLLQFMLTTGLKHKVRRVVHSHMQRNFVLFIMRDLHL